MLNMTVEFSRIIPDTNQIRVVVTNTVRQGIVIVMPITSTVKPEIKMMIPIPDGFKVHGSVIVEQIRTVDLNQRWWKTTGEILPESFVNHIVDTFKVIISS
jgi:mRNA interferase MazF